MDPAVFRTALRGYSPVEVDELLDRVERTLAGTAGNDAVEPEAVRSALFSIVLRGYREDDVDEYLDQVVAELERRAIQPAPTVPLAEPVPPEPESWTDLVRERAELLRCAELPAGQRFGRAGTFRGGYTVEEVDAFVDRARRLGTRLSGAEVCAAMFASSRGGYDVEAVDTWLGRLESNLDRWARSK